MLAFSTQRKLRSAAKKSKPNVNRDWLGKQDDYTFHRPARKHFARNPYTVPNVMDVWECDLVDVRPTQCTTIITDIFIR